MRKLLIQCSTVVVIIVIAVVVLSNAGAGKKIESYHEETGDASACFFHIADYQSGFHGGPCGFGRAVNWNYAVSCSGAGDHFGFQDVSLDAGLETLKPVAGEIFVDRTNRRVTIALQVAQGKHAVDFIGNGTFRIPDKRH